MKRTLIGAFSVIFLYLMTAGCDTNDPGDTDILILSNDTGTSSFTSWGINTGSTRNIAQSFVLGSDTKCKKLSLKFFAHYNSPEGDYTVSICNDNSGEPGSALVSLTKTAAEITPGSWNDWAFATETNLTAGTTYWIYCSSVETVSNACVRIYYTFSNVYTDGIMMYQQGSSSWNEYTDSDLMFRLYQ